MVASPRSVGTLLTVLTVSSVTDIYVWASVPRPAGLASEPYPASIGGAPRRRERPRPIIPRMPHAIETASSGRAKCRACERKIDKGELRFGERQPNAFGDGEMTLWFHLPCAAYRRPEPFLEAAADAGSEDLAPLIAAARFGLAHRRLPRLTGAERSPTGRARCRYCKELIAKDEWRIGLAFFEEFRFQPGGFVHATCAPAYFETADLVDRIRHFSPDLDAAALAELDAVLGAHVA